MAEEVLCLIYVKEPLFKEWLMSVCDILSEKMYDA
jgi:hypothetical protein